MSKIELTIAPEYVPSWTIVDAVRELFQNALDQQAQNEQNKASWRYDEQMGILFICNKTSKLTANSLLLGTSTKASDKSTIGQFGEGYKIATLVLLRNGKNVTYYNYGAKEIWKPRFVNSRRFNTKVLTFFTEKADSFWKKAPSSDLVIAVEGITADEYYNEIVPSNLHLRSDYNIIESTTNGDVIDLPGKVFVNGLFVCDYEPYNYGYNFKPEYLRLDRDRKMVSDFDLRWKASELWSRTNSDLVMDMLVRGSADVAYLDSMWQSTQWRTLAYDKFRSVYGPEAIPVVNQEELEKVPQGYKGVIVSSTYSALIKLSANYIEPSIDEPEPLDKLKAWFESIRDKLTVEEEEEFNSILEELE